MNLSEAIATFNADRPNLEALGISWQDGVEPFAYLTPEMKQNNRLAMDALANIPATATDPNGGIPALLTTFIDPQVYEVRFAANKAAEILGEVRRGTWLDQTAIFPVIEATGEVSSYGDFSNNGRAGVNPNFPQVQSYLFQLIKEYGEYELERAGLARINYVSEIDKAAALTLNKFENFTYFFGVQGLQNYGLLNNPFLNAVLTPGTKAAGGTAWVNTSGQVVATANEIYNDIQATFIQLVSQFAGLVDADTPMVLALSPTDGAALTATNSFNVNVADLLKKNFSGIRVVTAVQYGAKTATNPQGVAAGNTMQLIATDIEGQKTGFAAYNEKMRAHKIVPELSAWKQKMSAGTWGTVLRQPFAVAGMVGI